MTDEEFELMQWRVHELDADPAISHLDGVRSRSLAVMRERIRTATDELVREMGYKIIDVHPSRPSADAADGILWGYRLIVERLESILSQLQQVVVDGVLTAREAVDRAHRYVLATVRELRYGAHVRGPRVGASGSLPPAAELGRICAIVERLSGELATLAEACDREHSTGATFRVFIQREP